MIDNLSTRATNILIFFVLVTLTYLGYTFVPDNHVAATIWPVIGVATGLYMGYRNDVIWGIVLGLFIGRLFSHFILYDEQLYETIIYSIVYTSVNVLQIYLFKYFMEKSNSLGRIDVSSSIGYFFAIFGTTLIGAFISVTFTEFVNYSGQYFTNLIRWYIGDLAGLLIFGTLVLCSFYYNEHKTQQKLKKNLFGTFFLILYLITMYVMFTPNSFNFTYQSFGYIFIVFYFIAGIALSFRMLAVISLFFLIMFHHVYLGTDVVSTTRVVIFSENLYLFILSTLSATIRMILYDINIQNEELAKSNDKLESLIESTNKLLNIKDMDLSNTDNNIQYIKDIFQIATNLYDNYELASCYVAIDGEPVYIDAIGYDVDAINDLGFTSKNFRWALQKPEHIRNAEKSISDRLGKAYRKYSKTIPPIKESIRFGIYIDDKMTGGMSFDIKQDSQHSFTRADYENFSSFQKLMNSFYETSLVNSRNIALKNDIVLSLIQTLEFYDQYTGGHSEEVAFLSREIATRMNLSEDAIYDIYWAGIVHDIGKVGVDTNIINKKSKLTTEEYTLVKSHPEFGAKILEKSEDLKKIAKLVRHHHEWWNGNGYPDGIKGNEIPLGSQILCISDAVSSMYGKRPYQNSKTKEEILEEISLYTGAQFSPKIAIVMMDLINEGILQKLKK